MLVLPVTQAFALSVRQGASLTQRRWRGSILTRTTVVGETNLSVGLAIEIQAPRFNNCCDESVSV